MKSRYSSDDDFKVMIKCFLCGDEFQFGPHRYAGKYIHQWGMDVCEICLSSNRDGIVPGTYPHLEPYLASKCIKITYNVKGWIPWPV